MQSSHHQQLWRTVMLAIAGITVGYTIALIRLPSALTAPSSCPATCTGENCGVVAGCRDGKCSGDCPGNCPGNHAPLKQ